MTEDQLDLQVARRVRDGLVGRCAAVVNQIRAFLLERGISFRVGRAWLRRQIATILDEAAAMLTPLLRLLKQLWEEWKRLDE